MCEEISPARQSRSLLVEWRAHAPLRRPRLLRHLPREATCMRRFLHAPGRLYSERPPATPSSDGRLADAPNQPKASEIERLARHRQ